jgi:hypothetical protein
MFPPSELDCDAVLRFRHAIGERRGRGGAYVLPNTLSSHFEALASLFHLRDELGDGLLVDPFVGRSPRQLAGAAGVAHYGPYTPDVIAIPLVQQSIEFLEHGAIEVLRARETYASAMAQALERIAANGSCNRSVLEVLGTYRSIRPGVNRGFSGFKILTTSSTCSTPRASWSSHTSSAPGLVRFYICAPVALNLAQRRASVE